MIDYPCHQKEVMMSVEIYKNIKLLKTNKKQLKHSNFLKDFLMTIQRVQEKISYKKNRELYRN